MVGGAVFGFLGTTVAVSSFVVHERHGRSETVENSWSNTVEAERMG